MLVVSMFTLLAAMPVEPPKTVPVAANGVEGGKVVIQANRSDLKAAPGTKVATIPR